MDNLLFKNLKLLILKFPSVGNKLASRMTFFILNNKEFNKNLQDELTYVYKNIQNCETCNNFTKLQICNNCKNTSTTKKLCIVNNNNDYYHIYNKEIFKGNFFILNEEIDMNTPKPIGKIKKLEKFIADNKFTEIIIAINSTINGELTTNFLIKSLKKLNIKISRLAYGIPIGSEIENIDDYTLKHAFINRKKQ